MFINIQDNRHFKKLLTKQKYSSVVTNIFIKIRRIHFFGLEEMETKNMRAVVVRETGSSDVLKIEEIKTPSPGDGQALVRVDACGVCRHDILVRKGIFRKNVSYPVVLGHEISGEIVSTGKNFKEFKCGDRVVCLPWSNLCRICKFCRTGRNASCPDAILIGDTGLNGGYAEYVIIDDYNIVKLPEQISADEASFISCAIGTVFNAVIDIGKVTPRDTVLVTGANGGLGIHAIQFANLSGARVIAHGVSANVKNELCKYGVDEVVITKRGEDFSQIINDLTDGNGVDVVIDCVGTSTFKSVLKSIAHYGRWVFCGQISGDFVKLSPAQIFLKGINLLSTYGSTKEHLESAVKLVAQGKIKPVIAKRFSLADAKNAHDILEAGGNAGRIVLTVFK